MMTDFLNRLTKELQYGLPGEKAHIKMAPSVRNIFKSKGTNKNAGVLILLYPKNNSIYTALIQRTKYDGPHSGQISLPGGKFEEKDSSIIDTALRESHEEIGINPQKTEVLGQLTPLRIPVSNFTVYPIIGAYADCPHFKADKTEVERIIEIDLRTLINPSNCTTKEFNYGKLSFSAPVYNVSDVTIWGATAMMLSEFIEVIKTTNFRFPV